MEDVEREAARPGRWSLSCDACRHGTRASARFDAHTSAWFYGFISNLMKKEGEEADQGLLRSPRDGHVNAVTGA